MRPGWETVTCPRADSQQRADLGSEPRQIPELNAVLALNAAAGGAARTLHRAASAHLPFLVCSLPSMSRQDPRPPGQTRISHHSLLHTAPRPLQGLLR